MKATLLLIVATTPTDTAAAKNANNNLPQENTMMQYLQRGRKYNTSNQWRLENHLAI